MFCSSFLQEYHFVSYTISNMYILWNLSAFIVFVTAAAAQTHSNFTPTISNNRTTEIPQEATYLLPSTFAGNISLNFIDTNTTNSSLDFVLSRARSSPFISYSSEFTSLLGPNPQVKLIAQNTSYAFAYEAGVWVPPKDEAWFTSPIENGNSSAYILNLNTSKITQPSFSQTIPNPTGGYYFNNKVYFTAIGNETLAGGVYSVDPYTFDAEVVVNSYFGSRFNGPDDITWGKFSSSSASNNTNTTELLPKPVMFFTDINSRSYVTGYKDPPGLPDAVWRFSPQDKLLLPVISRADILVPNGIRLNRDSTKLYVTDTPIAATVGSDSSTSGGAISGSPAIFSFDLTSDGFPVNKRLISLTRHGVSDGLHVDDQGRIWTGESEGVVVRNAEGRVLGLFNAEALLIEGGMGDGTYGIPITNFALAGDTLVILAVQRIWTVKLAETLIDPSRFEL